MSDETEKKGRPFSFLSSVNTILGLMTLTLLGFFGSHLWRTQEKQAGEMEDLRDQVKSIKDDKSKWATLAEVYNRSIEHDKMLAVQAAEIEWTKWSLSHQFTIRVEQPSGTESNPNPKPPAPIKPPTPPPAKAENPKLSPEELRKVFEQRYPNEPFQKKK